MTAQPAELLATCRTKATLYSEKEVEFLRSIANPFALSQLSPAQLKWLVGLAEREEIKWDEINRAALAVLQTICRRWLSDGVLHGKEWVARNPTRSDNKPGSFRVNITTGKWADFAQDGARGGDPISLAAYLFHAGDQIAAAIDVKRMVGL